MANCSDENGQNHRLPDLDQEGQTWPSDDAKMVPGFQNVIAYVLVHSSLLRLNLQHMVIGMVEILASFTRFQPYLWVSSSNLNCCYSEN